MPDHDEGVFWSVGWSGGVGVYNEALRFSYAQMNNCMNEYHKHKYTKQQHFS